MAFIRIEWATPDDVDTWSIQKIERATSEAGSYSEIASVASSLGNYTDQDGGRTLWYKTRFYDPNTGNYDEYTNAIQGGDSAGYLTVEEARKLTKLQESEFDDETLFDLIFQATKRIDNLTGRTWQGIQTVSNEYYDGDGNAYLRLVRGDVQSLTALAVDKTGSGTFTTVTTSKVDLYEYGALYLDSTKNADIEASIFPEGYKNVRVSYTYGTQDPTQDIKELAVMLIIQFIKQEDSLDARIKESVRLLKDGVTQLG